MIKYTARLSAIMRGRTTTYGDLPVIIKQVTLEARDEQHAKDLLAPHLKSTFGWKWARIDRAPIHLARVPDFSEATVDMVYLASEGALLTTLEPEPEPAVAVVHSEVVHEDVKRK